MDERSDIENELTLLLDSHVTISDIARRLALSRPTVYKMIRDLGRSCTSKYTNIADSDLEACVIAIKERHPESGEVMITGHLRTQGIFIRRQHLRRLLQAVDREGIAARRTLHIRRRLYEAPSPNYAWHIDGLHKLIRWKFVIHGSIDGYSRLITFLKCSDNNESTTVLKLFDDATGIYGLPLRIRTDAGGENSKIWRRMLEHRNSPSCVIVGSSVHNQRVERMWRDVNRLVSNQFRTEFYTLEEQGNLDVDNETDLYCLHIAYSTVINQVVEEFRSGYNNHSVRTEGNYTPQQLFCTNQHLFQLQCQASSPAAAVLPPALMSETNPYVVVRRTNIAGHLPADLLQELDGLRSSATDIVTARGVYLHVSQRIYEYLSVNYLECN